MGLKHSKSFHGRRIFGYLDFFRSVRDLCCLELLSGERITLKLGALGWTDTDFNLREEIIDNLFFLFSETAEDKPFCGFSGVEGVNGVRGRPGVGETHSGEACPGRVLGGRCCLRVEGACNPGDCLRVAKVWDA